MYMYTYIVERKCFIHIYICIYLKDLSACREVYVLYVAAHTLSGRADTRNTVIHIHVRVCDWLVIHTNFLPKRSEVSDEWELYFYLLISTTAAGKLVLKRNYHGSWRASPSTTHLSPLASQHD